MITLDDLRQLDVLVNDMCACKVAKAQQSVNSVGYATCVENYWPSIRAYEAYLTKLKDKAQISNATS